MYIVIHEKEYISEAYSKMIVMYVNKIYIIQTKYTIQCLDLMNTLREATKQKALWVLSHLTLSTSNAFI